MKLITARQSVKSTKSVKFAGNVMIEGASEMGANTNSGLPWIKAARRKIAAKSRRKNLTDSSRETGRLHSTDESNQGNESNSLDDLLANICRSLC